MAFTCKQCGTPLTSMADYDQRCPKPYYANGTHWLEWHEVTVLLTGKDAATLKAEWEEGEAERERLWLKREATRKQQHAERLHQLRLAKRRAAYQRRKIARIATEYEAARERVRQLEVLKANLPNAFYRAPSQGAARPSWEPD